MKTIHQAFAVNYKYDVHFTSETFDINNPILSKVIKKQKQGAAKTLVFIDENIANFQPEIIQHISAYAKAHHDVINLCEEPVQLIGGEAIKNNPSLLSEIYKKINKHGICRHSYVIAIGGGALLDAVGFAAATAHRGIRLIRMPTTVLAQADSGVGVKNGINYYGKKNYLGVFTPPYAVINDFSFLQFLEYRDWLSGVAEATKVSLIKDAIFFDYIHKNIQELNQKKNMQVMQHIIYRSAELHMNHIAYNGDPFEHGSSRPLDFGHWSAHKLEQTTQHRLRHGEAVAIGVALDTTYSYLINLLPKKDWELVLNTLDALGFTLYVPELSYKMDNPKHPDSIFKGLDEFREHLGGNLTIMMLKNIGTGSEIHEVDYDIFQKAIKILENKFKVEHFERQAA